MCLSTITFTITVTVVADSPGLEVAALTVTWRVIEPSGNPAACSDATLEGARAPRTVVGARVGNYNASAKSLDTDANSGNGTSNVDW
jgi:hypothetical protein